MLVPPDLGAETPAAMAEARPAEQALHRVDLRRLEAHEMPAARQRLAHAGDRGRRHVHDGAIDPAPQPVAELERIPPVTLLVGRRALSRTSRASITRGAHPSAVNSRATKNATVPVSRATGVPAGRC